MSILTQNPIPPFGPSFIMMRLVTLQARLVNCIPRKVHCQSVYMHLRRALRLFDLERQQRVQNGERTQEQWGLVSNTTQEGSVQSVVLDI